MYSLNAVFGPHLYTLYIIVIVYKKNLFLRGYKILNLVRTRFHVQWLSSSDKPKQLTRELEVKKGMAVCDAGAVFAYGQTSVAKLTLQVAHQMILE
jgi:hypothetical protein